MFVLVYVDDIIITGEVAADIDVFVQQLHTVFSLKDMGTLHYFLGIEATQTNSGTLHLCQRKYILNLLNRCGLIAAKGVPTPMVSTPMLSKHDGVLLKDPKEYRSINGALQYIVLTRPDIAYVVNRICQFMHAPTNVHMTALKRVL